MKGHAMIAISRFPTGATVWFCEKCNRKFVLQIEPAVAQIVLERGNPNVKHSATIGGINLPQVIDFPYGIK